MLYVLASAVYYTTYVTLQVIYWGLGIETYDQRIQRQIRDLEMQLQHIQLEREPFVLVPPKEEEETEGLETPVGCTGDAALFG